VLVELLLERVLDLISIFSNCMGSELLVQSVLLVVSLFMGINKTEEVFNLTSNHCVDLIDNNLGITLDRLTVQLPSKLAGCQSGSHLLQVELGNKLVLGDELAVFLLD